MRAWIVFSSFGCMVCIVAADILCSYHFEAEDLEKWVQEKKGALEQIGYGMLSMEVPGQVSRQAVVLCCAIQFLNLWKPSLSSNRVAFLEELV